MFRKFSYITIILFIYLSSSEATVWQHKTWKVNLHNNGFIISKGEKKRVAEKISMYPTYAPKITKELHQIALWMEKNDFPQAGIWGNYINGTPEGTVVGEVSLFTPRKGVVDTSNLLAGYLTSTGTISLKDKDFFPECQKNANSTECIDIFPILPLKHKITLAHELTHAVEREIKKTSKYKSMGIKNWFDESLAEAVGQAWVDSNGLTEVDSYKYNYANAFNNPEDLYDNNRFFFYLGKDLISKKFPMKYYPNIVKEKYTGGESSIITIDNFLKKKNTSLSKYFPKFLNRHTNDKSYYPDIVFDSSVDFSPGKYVEDPEKDSIHMLSLTIPLKKSKKQKRQIKAIAGVFTALNIAFDNSINWNELRNKERIYLFKLSHLHASNSGDDLRLIYDKKIYKKSAYFAFYAETGSLIAEKKLKNIIVSNISKNPDESKAQSFQLKIKASRMKFDIPKCMRVSSFKRLNIGNISTLSLLKKQQIFLSVSAGKIADDLTYTAPKRAQKVTFYLTIPTLSGKKKRITLETTEIRKDYCGEDIMMTVSQSSGLKVIWYKRNGLSKLKNNGKTIITVKNGNYKLHLGNRRLKASKEMIESRGHSLTFSFMDTSVSSISPKKFTETFSWEALHQRIPNISCTEKDPYICKSGAYTFTYDDNHKLLELKENGNWMRFEYGKY